MKFRKASCPNRDAVDPNLTALPTDENDAFVTIDRRFFSRCDWLLKIEFAASRQNPLSDFQQGAWLRTGATTG
ncbi:MAG TPA: hypothetical protein VFK72_07675, partial [Nevskia sp.]|nr:hypothetical protein [Nevskia sp.]